MTLPTPTTASAAATTLPTSALVVDDDPFMLEYLGDMLRDLGLRDVRTARGGQEAARCLDGPHPDVVLCDLNMPGRDGFLFMEDLAARQYKGRVVVVSGMDARTLNSATLMARFHRLKVVGALTKPVERAALDEALSRRP